MDNYAHLRNSLSYMYSVFIPVQCIKNLKISISRKELSSFPKKLIPMMLCAKFSGSGRQDFKSFKNF